jgi:hypothetical protein
MERRGRSMPATLALCLAVVGDGFGASGGRGEVGVEMVLEPDVILSRERPLEYCRRKVARCAVFRSTASRSRFPQRNSVVSG